ncbi:hypothetical protein KSD_80580 [Ktedonobacter sp. SOSP1-85]|uniref:DUF3841 domain-containing protein n=1 Tax=Ktedonobacter sp. SOSP1-85 TaxID=2778367 RepID=UPI0019153A43|nr:DUF3841 domain-containing protein [Ktedonobacter sp. SOSP1-85]GHO80287.1 hypothetical protein KSD_80580 [Ktedonobacter sp. SOSP1-85]
MLIWTIQSLQVWEKLQQDGFIYGPGPDLINRVTESWQWQTAYQWMAEQMERCIGKRPKPNISPLWAWFQWRDVTHRKPDLRSSGHLAPGTKGVRLACEIPDDQMLLSDFLLWHHALNYGYLSLSQAEEEAFEAELAADGLTYMPLGPLSDPVFHQRILESWQRIFDLDGVGHPDWLGNQTRDEKAIQATFWQLSLDQIREVTLFTSR